MKLYATTTSERATKGQGGNKRIDIQLQGENMQDMGVIAFRYNDDTNLYYCNYINQGEVKSIFQIKGKK